MKTQFVMVIDLTMLMFGLGGIDLLCCCRVSVGLATANTVHTQHTVVSK